MTASFPQAPLDCKVGIYTGTWQDITTYALQRAGSPAPLTISRGRPNERTTLSPSQLGLQLNNRDGRFTARNPTGPYYGSIGLNTPIRVSVPASGTALRIEDDTTSFSSAPGSGVLPAGAVSMDFRMDLALTGWAACTLMSWWGSSGERAWLISLNADGTVTFSWTADGTTGTLSQATSTRPLPLIPGCLRVTLDHVAGVITFYTAPPGSIGGSSWTQLGAAAGPGTAIVIIGSTAVFSVGYNSTANSDFGLPGLAGKVNDALVMSGIAGSIKAQPAFSSQAAGATTWADAESNTWTLGGTAEISGRSYRCHCEMANLPQAWDPTGRDVFVPLAAAGVWSRIQQNNVPLPSAMRRAASLMSALAAYWPCEDGAGTKQLGSGIAGSQQPMYISGNSKAAADSSFACSGALPQVEGGTWQGLTGQQAPGTAVVVRFLLNPTTEVITGNAIATIDTSGTQGSLLLTYNVLSGLELVGSGGLLATGVTLATGAPVMISIELTASGGNVTYVIKTMDTEGRIFSATSAALSGTFGQVQRITINPTGVSLGQTAVGHIIVQSALSDLSASLSGPIAAWAGETAAARFARLCAENGIASRITGYPAASIAMGIQGVAALSTLLQECETADGGMMYEPRQCLGLGYRTRSSMYNQAAKVTLDYALTQLGQTGQPGELTPTDDTLLLVNDVLAQRGSSGASQGGTAQVTLNDGSPSSISPPPVGVGDYQDTPTYNLQADSQLASRASWALHIGTSNQQRIPFFPLNLARTALSSLLYAIQGCDIGDRVVVVNPPAWLPPDPITQLIAGTTEELGGFFWLAEWNTIPEQPYETGIAGDAVLGRADTEGSQLAGNIGTGDTSFSVTTTAGPSWTADSALFTAAGSFSVLPPFGIFAMNSQGWAAGCGGGGSNTSTTKGGGGGGGEYAAEPALAVIPNIPVVVVVGAAGASSGTGTGGTGGNTTITGPSATVTAHAGTGGGAAGSAGAGGTGSANTVHHDGGVGGTSPSSGDGGGSGGGSGGTSSAGNAGTNATSAAATPGATAVTGGGPGGAGGAHSLPGSAPASGPGGGGGGAGGNTGGNSGAGDPGQALLSWTSADFPFDISVGGERMTVSHIQGQGATQLFTISARSVNGVVKSHSAGDAVSEFTKTIAAL